MQKYFFLLLILPFLLQPADADARKKRSPRYDEKAYLAMIEPDEMVKPCAPAPIVSPVEEARRHHINSDENRFGIDVSRYQGNIDWQRVSTDQNVSYVYVKATEGESLVDRTYHYNLKEARKAGLKVGCYHFFRPNVRAEEQFKNFSTTVDKNEQDLIPIIDVEIRGRSGIETFHKRLRTFLDMVEKHYGVVPIIYTSSNFYNKYLAGRYTRYKYMIARYKEEIPELTDDIKFVMWQFTANGRIKGINGPVDRSRFMDDYRLGDIIWHKTAPDVSQNGTAAGKP